MREIEVTYKRKGTIENFIVFIFLGDNHSFIYI